ncbi:MAG: lysylphosphatidylglycerol synthase transmembrane domain-containing protein [Chloroflexota bacterium]
MGAREHPATDRIPARRSWTSLLLRWIGLPISAAAIWILVNSVDVSTAGGALATAHLVPLAGATAVIAVQIALVTARWRLLLPLTPAGRQPRYLATARGLLVGYLGNFVLPARLGEAVRAYLVARLENLPLTATFASVILERVVDTASIALIAFVVALALDMPAWVVQISGLVAAAGLLVFTVVAFGFLSVLSGWLLRLTPAASRTRLLALSVTMDDLSRGLSGGGRWGTILLVLVISLASWGLESAVYLLVARSLGIVLTLPEALLLAGVTVLATAVPSAPAYLGTFELAATALASALGIPPASALAFAVLVHITTVVPLAIGGLVSLATIGIGLAPLARIARSAEDGIVAQADG